MEWVSVLSKKITGWLERPSEVSRNLSQAPMQTSNQANTEVRIHKNLAALAELTAKAILIHKSKMFVLDEALDLSDVLEKFKRLKFSHIPVFRGQTSNITGVVHRFELLEAFSQDRESEPLYHFCHPVHRVHIESNLVEVLDRFLEIQENIFLVEDDHGDIAGLITLEDTMRMLMHLAQDNLGQLPASSTSSGSPTIHQSVSAASLTGSAHAAVGTTGSAGTHSHQTAAGTKSKSAWLARGQIRLAQAANRQSHE